jgi:hypothetical protein
MITGELSRSLPLPSHVSNSWTGQSTHQRTQSRRAVKLLSANYLSDFYDISLGLPVASSPHPYAHTANLRQHSLEVFLQSLRSILTHSLDSNMAFKVSPSGLVGFA